MLFAGHHWPSWGGEQIVDFLEKQRDLYAYLHDQTLRLLNQGHTGPRSPRLIELPPSLADEWHCREFYGSVSHNVKAIYQRYMGWFDGNPAHLWEHPPVEQARRYVEFMGGADAVLEKARESFEDGDYRWVAEVVNHVVFADPDNREARELQAEALEQLGYGAENATWRNFFLMGAKELREGISGTPTASAPPDLLAHLTVSQLLDAMAIRLDGPRAGRAPAHRLGRSPTPTSATDRGPQRRHAPPPGQPRPAGRSRADRRARGARPNPAQSRRRRRVGRERAAAGRGRRRQARRAARPARRARPRLRDRHARTDSGARVSVFVIYVVTRDGNECARDLLKPWPRAADANFMDPSPARRLPEPKPVAVWIGALSLLLAAYAAVTLLPLDLSAGVEDFFGRWVYDAIVLGAAGVVLYRAARLERERLAWLGLGAGMLLWALGQSYYSVVLYYASPAPFPSPADILFLAFYPATYLALILLLRSRASRVDGFAWVDGLIGALAVASIAAALIFPSVLESLGGSHLGVAVSLAYPCADLVLLGLVAGALTASSWRVHGAWPLIAAALTLFGVADVVYLSVGGQSTEALNLASIAWPLAFILLAAASWYPYAAVEAATKRSARSIALPVGLATVVIGLLALGNVVPIGPVAVGLGAAALVAAMARLAATFAVNMKMLASSEREATTDALTGLRNRRSLLADLERELSVPEPPSTILALFDLDGFKSYNDSFGHTAGDELLRRLGAKLQAAVEERGAAYRLGGDEFCVLVSNADGGAERAVKAAEAALCEKGPSFTIRASWGKARLPVEAATPKEALKTADRRMYAQKGQRADSALSQTRGVLLGVLREREPDLDRRLGGVAQLAAAMGRSLGLEAERLDVLVRAAEMHDIGKIAIPDEILHKSGPMTEAEEDLVHKHTLVGERVLAAAPALREVAKVVRSSHENWDGSGYPDGLAGTAIPLEARVIRVCDAYSSMTDSRPYGHPLSESEALAELRVDAGTEFDPELVELFAREVAVEDLELEAPESHRPA